MSLHERYPFLSEMDPSEYDFESSWTRNNPGKPYSEQDVFAALLATKGNYRAMGDLLNRSRNSVAEYVRSNADMLEARNEIFESIYDDIEQNYHERAMMGDEKAMKFLMTTKMADRGYGSVSQQPDETPKPLSFSINVHGATKEVTITRGEDSDAP